MQPAVRACAGREGDGADWHFAKAPFLKSHAPGAGPTDR